MSKREKLKKLDIFKNSKFVAIKIAILVNTILIFNGLWIGQFRSYAKEYAANSTDQETKNGEDGVVCTKFLEAAYPSTFNNDRKKVFSFLKKIGEGEETYTLLTYKSGSYKQTIKGGDYLYYGKIKDGYPEGLGVIVSNIEYGGKRIFIPEYAGSFKKGTYSGYGIKVGIYGITEEGKYKEGKLNGKGIIYESLVAIHNKIMADGMKKYLSGAATNKVLVDFPVLKPSIIQEGEFKNDKLNGKNAKIYYSVYASSNGKYYRTTEDTHGQLQYKGEMKKNVATGDGVLYYESGKIKYKGKFKNGKYNGKGTLYNVDGSVKYKGEFKNGDVK